MRWLDSITDSMDMNMSKFQEMVEDRKAWSAAVLVVAKSWTQLRDFIFEIASKYCILDFFVDHDGYSISSEGFPPTLVDIMVI